MAATIVVDKPAGSARAYDPDGHLLAFYPATMGSAEKPAPSGQFTVKGVAWNPEYQYDPKFAWKGVKAKRGLTVGRGPTTLWVWSGSTLRRRLTAFTGRPRLRT
jgi:hypothetical protein